MLPSTFSVSLFVFLSVLLIVFLSDIRAYVWVCVCVYAFSCIYFIDQQ